MLRLLQVGVRGMGNHWVQVGKASPDFETVAYVDIVPEHLELLRRDHGVPPERCFLDLGEALAATRPDAVLNVTPPPAHAPIALQAFDAGCHVLTEKPLADTPERCLAMVEAGRQAGRVLMVAQNYRYSHVIQALKARLIAGDLGSVEQVSVQFFRGPRFQGFRAEMEQPLVVDMAIHHFDLMRYLLEAEPVAVYAQSHNPSWSWYAGDASASAIFDFRRPDGTRIHVNYTGSWCAKGPDTPWNGNWRFVCSEGTVRLENDRIFVERQPGDAPEEVAVPVLERVGQDYLLHAFAESIRSGRPPETSGEDNLKSVAMVFKAVESIREGRRITF